MKHPKFKFSAPSQYSRREFVQMATTFLAMVASGCATGKLGRKLAGADAPAPDLSQPFDYIVVGSGAGGGPVAARLAQAGMRVLLLEAGGDTDNDHYEVPAFQGLSTEDPELSWNFFVRHYKDATRGKRDTKKWVDGKGILYPRGATLGGSTAHNALITLYPDNRDWENLVQLTGDPSFNPTDMRRYFEKVEDAKYCPEPLVNVGRHGHHGWLSVEQTKTKVLGQDLHLLDMVVAAAEESGLTGNLYSRLLSEVANSKLDPNDWLYVTDKRDGIFNIPRATNGGKRNGTRELLLDTQSRYPRNLFIQKHSVATQIILEGDERRATGVKFLEGPHLYRADANPSKTPGVPREARATREVIVATGAFNSPQLLMLSGIGARAELAAKGIDTRVDLPGVGKNLQDRYEITVVSEAKRDFSLIESCAFDQPGDPCLAKWKQDPANATYATNGVVIANIKRSDASKPDPDLVIFGTPGDFRGYKPGWAKEALARKDIFTWSVLKGHTSNTAGTVGLADADPLSPPDICFNYFDEGNGSPDADLNAIIEGVKTARRINARWPATNVIKDELSPGPAVDSDEKLAEHIKDQSWGHHASCSNKMGVAQDPQAVVDSKFRVFGTKGLRVVDASVFPKIPGLFIAVPIYMIAEKASEDILADARKG